MHSPILLALSFVLAAIASPNTFFLNTLQKRQFDSSSFPSQCSSQCQSFEDSFTKCDSDPKCFCSASVIQSLASCTQCAANAVGDASTFQSAIDQLQQSCAQLGVSIPSQTITGAGVSATNSGNSPSQTSSGNSSAIPTALLVAGLAGLGFAVTFL